MNEISFENRRTVRRITAVANVVGADPLIRGDGVMLAPLTVGAIYYADTDREDGGERYALDYVMVSGRRVLADLGLGKQILTVTYYNQDCYRDAPVWVGRFATTHHPEST